MYCFYYRTCFSLRSPHFRSFLFISPQAPREQQLASIKAFAEQAAPVLEHYAAFNKVLVLPTEDTLVQPAVMAKAHLAPLVSAKVLAVAPAKEKGPMKPPKMPRKKVVAPPEEVF